MVAGTDRRRGERAVVGGDGRCAASAGDGSGAGPQESMHRALDARVVVYMAHVPRARGVRRPSAAAAVQGVMVAIACE